MNQIRWAMRRAVPCLSLFVALACSSSTSPGKGLNGTWDRVSDIPGNGETITLTTVGNAVSGSGHWTGEACCSGTISVSGTRSGAAVSLDLVYTTLGGVPVSRHSAHFAGRLSLDHLTGTVTSEGASPAPATYERAQMIAY